MTSGIYAQSIDRFVHVCLMSPISLTSEHISVCLDQKQEQASETIMYAFNVYIFIFKKIVEVDNRDVKKSFVDQ